LNVAHFCAKDRGLEGTFFTLNFGRRPRALYWCWFGRADSSRECPRFYRKNGFASPSRPVALF
jgi:hypothetical protein